MIMGEQLCVASGSAAVDITQRVRERDSSLRRVGKTECPRACGVHAEQAELPPQFAHALACDLAAPGGQS